MVVRITANKLAEYLVASSPVRRRAIIKDQKHGNKPASIRYRAAFEPIEAFLCRGRDRKGLIHAATSLRGKTGGSDFAIEDRILTADALEIFLDTADQLPDDGCVYTKGPTEAAKLSIGGVDVSVRPDFFLRFDRRGQKHIGALKLHFTKNDETSLQVKGAEYVASLLHRWLESFDKTKAVAARDHCFAIDAFRKRVVRAPTSYVRRMAELEAACEEIAAQWPRL